MTRRSLSPLFAARRAAVAAVAPALRWRHRRGPFVRTAPMPEAQPRPLEGYPAELWAPTGQPRAFHLRSPFDANTLVVERYAGPDAFEEVARQPFGRCRPETPIDAPVSGCGWPETLTLDTTGWRQGTYRARIEADADDADASERSTITFLVGPASPGARVAVFAPVTTWLAYNPYGGQSLYHNEIDTATTTLAHAGRPNPSLDWSPVGAIHAMAAEAPVFDWLDTEVGADLYPDWMLEHPDRLASYSALALAYHCEYASDAMVGGVSELVDGGRTLLAIGANQLYWRVRWDDANAVVECRKDGSRFADGARGGLWRRRGRPEDELLGVRFTAPGTGTYAPYRVADASHWLYDGLGVSDGDLFGMSGTTPLPICGDETDAPTAISGLATEVVARGMNRADAVDGDYTLYQRGNPAWNGAAGGTIALTERSATHGVLATGAIHSASGLGVDPVFTGIVRNALRRYGLGPKQ
ncbi:N,N-dimethylformamidase beta subunit family domain-containing protein [Rubrivirga sp. IMCC43871]|uniref:N,N-dimethylformamidase beta subunit family domain-containing protein n=1 Tax=Rubrivirga sp. IMCC43871 TaxID=3391575 RepID=UPI00398FD108